MRGCIYSVVIVPSPCMSSSSGIAGDRRNAKFLKVNRIYPVDTTISPAEFLQEPGNFLFKPMKSPLHGEGWRIFSRFTVPLTLFTAVILMVCV